MCCVHLFAVSFHKPSDKESKLFASLSFFLEHLALQDIHAAARCFTNGHNEAVFTPHEVDEYNRYSACMCVIASPSVYSVLLLNVYCMFSVAGLSVWSFWVSFGLLLFSCKANLKRRFL